MLSFGHGNCLVFVCFKVSQLLVAITFKFGILGHPIIFFYYRFGKLNLSFLKLFDDLFVFLVLPIHSNSTEDVNQR